MVNLQFIFGSLLVIFYWFLYLKFPKVPNASLVHFRSSSKSLVKKFKIFLIPTSGNKDILQTICSETLEGGGGDIKLFIYLIYLKTMYIDNCLVAVPRRMWVLLSVCDGSFRFMLKLSQVNVSHQVN